jgi:hypothetical protein
MVAGAGFIRQPLWAAPSAENGLHVAYSLRPVVEGLWRTWRLQK